MSSTRQANLALEVTELLARSRQDCAAPGNADVIVVGLAVGLARARARRESHLLS